MSSIIRLHLNYSYLLLFLLLNFTSYLFGSISFIHSLTIVGVCEMIVQFYKSKNEEKCRKEIFANNRYKATRLTSSLFLIFHNFSRFTFLCVSVEKSAVAYLIAFSCVFSFTLDIAYMLSHLIKIFTHLCVCAICYC